MATEEKPSVQWAMDLLEPTDYDQANTVLRYFLVPLFGISFAFVPRIRNHFMGVPRGANPHHVVFSGLAGAALGYTMNYISDAWHARQDAVLRDYVLRHPELFPAPENRKIADIFDPWKPVR